MGCANPVEPLITNFSRHFSYSLLKKNALECRSSFLFYIRHILRMRYTPLAFAGGLLITLFFGLFYLHGGPAAWADAFPRYQYSIPEPTHDKEGKSSSSSYAYATFLSSRTEDIDDDAYFTAARVLTYQILHHPTTRSQEGIRLLIIVPPHVPQKKRDILSNEGAVVIPIELLNPEEDWVHPANEGWVDQFAKLRLFSMTQYERILFIDADMLLTRSLDPIFNETVVQTPQRTRDDPSQVKSDEAALPSSYVFVGVMDKHGAFPNGGFWLIRPNEQLFRYYVSVLNIKDRFDSTFMEQSLLSYAHRDDGNMPAQYFEMGKWNRNWPSLEDVQNGTATLHDKFWKADNINWIDRPLVEMWWRMQGMMEGYWQRAKESGSDH